MSLAPETVHDGADPLAWGRAILLLPLAWWTLGMGTGRATWCFPDYVNLAFHEAGHVLLSFAGSTMHYLGGTLGQLAVPTMLIVYFLVRQRQPFAAAICAWWLGENCVNIAIYMADARTLALPLVGGGDHDWNELFFRFGLLAEPSVQRVSGLMHFAGVVGMTVGLAWGAFFVLPVRVRRNVGSEATARWPWLESALDS